MINYLFKKNILISILILSVFIIPFLFIDKNIKAQTQHKDTIAVRVIVNPEHYSPMRWYQEQGFIGSPQKMVVDGYQAIRDGRTVYVGAANVQAGSMYTNIYLMSYNQDAEQSTVDIRSRLLKNWKFNHNILDHSDCVLISTNASSSKRCLIDSDCDFGEYCASAKARVIRDTRRLADLKEIEIALNTYKEEMGHYPILGAGSYLPNRTVTAWPSWTEQFEKELEINNFKDPINKLGDCSDPRFNSQTCWDDQKREFDDPNPTNTIFELPADSKAYIYSTNDAGTSFNVCGTMESGYSSTAGSACAVGVTVAVSAIATNEETMVINSNLADGSSGKEYIGYIKVDNPDNDNLTWTIDTTASNWASWDGGNPPTFENTGDLNQKKFYSSSAGVEGIYTITITVDDNKGEANSIVTRTLNFTIINLPPNVSFDDMYYIASSTNSLNYKVIAEDVISQYPLTFTILPNPTLINSLTGASTYSTTTKEYYYDITGLFDTYYNSDGTNNDLNNDFSSQMTNRSFSLNVADSFGVVSNGNMLNIYVVNNPPVVTKPLGCDTDVRVNVLYTPCIIKASDPDGNLIVDYQVNGVAFPIETVTAGVLTLGGAFGVANANNLVIIEAIDEYNRKSEKVSFNLSINSYCGDGTKDVPNVEGRGGPSDNGKEACDGLSGIAISTADSSISKQYVCTTIDPPAGTGCPLTGACMNTCTLTGGYCGDGMVQTNAGQNNITEDCELAGTGASSTDQYECINCNWSGGYCGDSVVQSAYGEQCDGLAGVALNPADSSVFKQYKCTTVGCSLFGGYCGDGIV
ncbi:hypothetical protein KAI92_03015, partial [Candidatus Parcubacteria bacterium]|nr:hypothetical protein [Candidatus Parcubacteria bacterium]